MATAGRTGNGTLGSEGDAALGRGAACKGAGRTVAGVVPGTDGVPRCPWCAGDPLLEAYHDREWGFPVRHDRGLFEKLCLEGFQAGLSWRLVLQRREALRRAFLGFDVDALADVADIGAFLAPRLRDPALLRHRGKMEAVLHNARVARTIRERFGSLHAFFARFSPDPEPPAPHAAEDLAPETPHSRALSRELRTFGWRFVGPVSAQAFLESVGFENRHLAGCPWRQRVEAARGKERVACG